MPSSGAGRIAERDIREDTNNFSSDFELMLWALCGADYRACRTGLSDFACSALALASEVTERPELAMVFDGKLCWVKTANELA